MTDTLTLKSILLLKGYTIENIAKEMGLSATSMSYKINNRVEFKSSEIKRMQAILGLSNKQRDAIFFAANVD